MAGERTVRGAAAARPPGPPTAAAAKGKFDANLTKTFTELKESGEVINKPTLEKFNKTQLWCILETNLGKNPAQWPTFEEVDKPTPGALKANYVLYTQKAYEKWASDQPGPSRGTEPTTAPLHRNEAQAEERTGQDEARTIRHVEQTITILEAIPGRGPSLQETIHKLKAELRSMKEKVTVTGTSPSTAAAQQPPSRAPLADRPRDQGMADGNTVQENDIDKMKTILNRLMESLSKSTPQPGGNNSADHIFKGMAPLGNDPRTMFQPMSQANEQGGGPGPGHPPTSGPTSTISRGLEALLTNLAGSSHGGNKKTYFIKEHIPRTASELSSPIKMTHHLENGQWIQTPVESKNRVTAATYFAAAQAIETKTVQDLIEKGARASEIQTFKEDHAHYISRIMALFDDYERDAIIQLDNVLRSEVHDKRRSFKDDFSEKFVVYMTGKRLTLYTNTKPYGGNQKRPYDNQSTGNQANKRPDTKSPKPCDFFQRPAGCHKGAACSYEHKCTRCHKQDHGLSKCPLSKK